MCLALAAMMLSATVFTTTYNKQQKLFTTAEAEAWPILEAIGIIATVGYYAYEIWASNSSDSNNSNNNNGHAIEPTTRYRQDGTPVDCIMCLNATGNIGCTPGTFFDYYGNPVS